MNDSTQFRRCSTCKAAIAFGAKYYKCSVSTCNRRPTALYFCSVPCWDAHVPDARHRDAWAEEETAPAGPEEDADTAPLRRKVVSPGTGSSVGGSASSSLSSAESTSPTFNSSQRAARSDLPSDVLVVMSKIKGYIKAHSDLRTSDGVSDPLSDHLRDVCEAAVQSAKANGRGTVLARDVEAALRGTNASE